MIACRQLRVTCVGRTGRGSSVAAVAAASVAIGAVIEFRRADLAVSEDFTDLFLSALVRLTPPTLGLIYHV